MLLGFKEIARQVEIGSGEHAGHLNFIYLGIE